MIGKIVIGKDFYGVLAYNEKKVDNGMGYVIDSNIERSTPVNMTNEFNLIRQLRPGLGKAVFHVSLNLPHSDQMDDKRFALLGSDYLREMGFDDNQHIMYRHTDTQHEHIHIIANRVKYSGEVTSDSNIKRRSRKVINNLEKKYGLTQVLGKVNSKKSLTQKEIEKTLRTGAVPIKLMLQDEIGNAISKAKNTEEFIKMLKGKNISPRFNVSKTTGRVSGISFRYEDVIYKGSSLGKKYSWNNIIKHINYGQARDRTIVLSANEGQRTADTIGKGGQTMAVGHGRDNGGIPPSTENAVQEPKGNLGQAGGNGVTSTPKNEMDWTPFKLELQKDDNKHKKRRKRKRRRGLGL